MSLRMNWWTTIIPVVLCVAGCSKMMIVAPIDGYVCYPNGDHGDCPPTYVPELWEPLVTSEVNGITPSQAHGKLGPGELPFPILTNVPPSDDLISLPIAPGACAGITEIVAFTAIGSRNILGQSNEELPRSIAISQSNRADACAVIYSPLLVSQFIEDYKRLEYTIEACFRIEDAIFHQREMFEIQDELAPPDTVVETRNSEAAKDDIARSGILASPEVDEYLKNRAYVVAGAEQLRRLRQAQYLETEFVSRLRDAKFQVELAYSALTRQALILSELTHQPCLPGKTLVPTTPSQFWVTEGTNILEVR